MLDPYWKDTGLLIGGPFDGERRYGVVGREVQYLELAENIDPPKYGEMYNTEITLLEYKKVTYIREFFRGKEDTFGYWMYSGTTVDKVIERLFAAYRK